MYVVWNLTARCPWNCEFCCVSAKQTMPQGEYAKVDYPDELDLASKFEVLDQLIKNCATINFSGGDPLYLEDDRAIVIRAIESMPKTMIDISTTGIDFDESKLEILMRAGEVGLTLDNLESVANPYRPDGYNTASMRALQKLVLSRVKCAAVTILYPQTMTRENLSSVHRWLCDAGVPKWNILKFTAVGRGFSHKDLVVSNEQYQETMRFIEQLKGEVEVEFQHSLRILDKTDNCHALHDSIGILPSGAVLSCSWAIDRNGQPLKGFYLGKVPEEDLSEIIERSLNLVAYKCQPENCRITNCCSADG